MPAPSRSFTFARMCLLLAACLCLWLVAPTPAARAATNPRPLKIALVGDSYSAGNGAGSYEAHPNGCYRSSDNWANRYKNRLAAQGFAVTLVNRACSGATTAAFSATNTLDSYKELGTSCSPGAPDEKITKVGSPFPGVSECQPTLDAQVDSLGSDTDLVLLTFGGDDVDFSDIVKQCFIIGFRDPGDCRSYVQSATDKLSTVTSNLSTVFTKMKGKLRPDAKVVLLGYPQLIGDYGYVLKSHNLLGQVTDSYDAGTAVRNLGTQGAVAQQRAVDAANASGLSVTYVPVAKTFAGHEPDPRSVGPSSSSWLVQQAGSFNTNEWYHPNDSGHTAYANSLSDDAYGAGHSAANGGSLDLAFVIDTTGSMGGVIDTVKSQVDNVVDQLAAGTSSYRIAVTSFRDQPDYTGSSEDYASRVDQAFTSDAAKVKSAVAALSASGGGDYPESAYSGIIFTCILLTIL